MSSSLNAPAPPGGGMYTEATANGELWTAVTSETRIGLLKEVNKLALEPSSANQPS